VRGVGEAGGVEVFLVWFKLVVLVGLAGWGLAKWNPEMLSRGVEPSGFSGVIFGAASVFMAYEGFQLLAYDYDDIEDPDRNLPKAVLSAIAVVIGVYVIVSLGTVMLAGADEVVRRQEVALAIAGERALGTLGLGLVTVGAAFSTGSAINSTLFATARLVHEVAEDGELPRALEHENRAGIPDRAVVGLGLAAALLAFLGSLTTLVETASLAFLFTFVVVCGLAFQARAGNRWVTGAGVVAGAGATVSLIVRLAQVDPLALVALAGLVAIAVFVRPWVLRTMGAEPRS
jgi:amino acid transporter